MVQEMIILYRGCQHGDSVSANGEHVLSLVAPRDHMNRGYKKRNRNTLSFYSFLIKGTE